MEYILKGLRPLARPLEELTQWVEHDNPNKGDVEALATSLLIFGQRTPIVHGPEHIVKGNTTLKAAELLKSGWRPDEYDADAALGEGEWTHLATVDVEDDPVTAGAYAITDNRIRDLATTDEDALAEILHWINEESDLLVYTTYTEEDIEALTEWATDIAPFAEELEQARESGGHEWIDPVEPTPAPASRPIPEAEEREERDVIYPEQDNSVATPPIKEPDPAPSPVETSTVAPSGEPVRRRIFTFGDFRTEITNSSYKEVIRKARDINETDIVLGLLDIIGLSEEDQT